MKENNIIYLIDFFGHAAMDCEHSIELRFATLKDIISMHEVDKNHTVFAANEPGPKGRDFPLADHLRERFLEMKRVAELFGWSWITVDPEASLDAFHRQLELETPLGRIQPDNTHVIFGGTNTSGCVFHRRATSLCEHARQGFFTTLFLPLCSDPGSSGRNSVEKSVKSFSFVYNEIQSQQLWDKVNIKHRYADIQVPLKDKQ